MKKLFELENLRKQSRDETCEFHGNYVSRNLFSSVWSKCDKCIQVEKQNEISKSLEDEKHKFNSKLESAGVPLRFREKTFENFDASSAEKYQHLQNCKSYAKNFVSMSPKGKSLIFSGSPGTGKTHLACSIAIELIKNGQSSVLFYDVFDAVSRVKKTWSRGSIESQDKAFEELTSPDLLILDEVGVQFDSETEKLIMFKIINTRYQMMKPTILISNLNKDEIVKCLGERIIDRIREDGGKILCFKWESYRMNKTKIKAI